MRLRTCLIVASTNYSYKFLIALGLTPFLYVAHAAIDKFLGVREAHQLIERAAADHVQSYLVKPIKQGDLEPAIALAWQRFQELEALRRSTDV